jgi:hypothetical protein
MKQPPGIGNVLSQSVFQTGMDAVYYLDQRMQDNFSKNHEEGTFRDRVGFAERPKKRTTLGDRVK